MFLFSLNKYPEVKLLDHVVVLFLVFWGTSILFSIVTISMYIPTNSIEGLPFSTSLPTPVICCFFENSHSNRCEVLPHCGFDLHFPDDSWSRVSVCFLWGNVYSWTFPVAQWVKDPVLPLQWLGPLLWCSFHPWPRSFWMLQVWPKKEKCLFISSAHF